MKYFTKFIKYIFLPASLLWMTAQLVSVHIPNNFVLKGISELTQIPTSELILKPFDGPGFSPFDTFMYSSLVYSGLALLSMTTVLFGFLVLGKGRSWFEKLLLLQAFAIPRERINWGKIYDVETQKPIPFASLRLVQKKSGIESTILVTTSDLDGRYRMYAQIGDADYFLEVKASGYEPYLLELPKTSTSQNITANIPLQPFRNKLYTDSSVQQGLSKTTLYEVLIAYVYFASVITFLHIIYTLAFHFGWIAILNLIFYGFAAPWNTYVLFKRSSEKPGRIVDEATNVPIQAAQVLLYSGGKQVSMGTSNQEGVIQFAVEPGKYDLVLHKQGYTLGENNAVNPKANINSLGFLEHNVFVTPLDNGIAATNALLNPFGS